MKRSDDARGPLHDDELAPLPVDGDAETHAALVVCDRAGRGLDVRDPVQLLQAAALAAPMLEALGLLGGAPRRLSAGERKINGSVAPHGTRPAALRHAQVGQALCPACRRWAEVNERRTGEAAPPDPLPDAPLHRGAPQPSADGHGTYRAWRAHGQAGEAPCGACAGYAQWWGDQRRRGRWGVV